MKTIFKSIFLILLLITLLCIAASLLHNRPPKAVQGSMHFDSKKLPTATYAVGGFRIRWDISGGGQILIYHQNKTEKVIWASIPQQSFLAAGKGREKLTESRGSFNIQEQRHLICAQQVIDAIEQEAGGLVLRGSLYDKRKRHSTAYILRFEESAPHQLDFNFSVNDKAFNRLWLRYASDRFEHFYGMGAQFSHFDLKGKRVPVFVEEQGIGRGLQPLTFLLNLFAGSGGDWSSTYASTPYYLSSKCRSLFLHNYAYSAFDFREEDAVQIEVFDQTMRGAILYGDTPAEIIQGYTAATGRMRPLPDWILNGAVVGMQGGTEKVRAVYEKLQAYQTPIAAFWLQDWCGQRETFVGKQLWWNWELDHDRYPQWEDLRADFARRDIRIMTYVNPFLADIAALKPNLRRNLFKEASEKGFLIRTPEEETYLIQNTDFDAALLDLANPEACAWMEELIRKEVIGAGASGWMADFGEALPYDAQLHGASSAKEWHNHYPEAWAQLNRNVIEATGHGEDFVFFSRSGYRASPGISTLFWLGDQLVSWDAHDGIKSALTGLLSSGVSGFALNHSDIGGYTSVSLPGLRYHRSKELLMRWMELNAFSCIYRSHEGIDPEANTQFYDDEESLQHFIRFAKVYRAWAFYRKALVQEAAATGLPVVRHPFLHYPEDPVFQTMEHQEFLLGEDLLIIPVLDPGRTTVEAYLPQGMWVNLWTGLLIGVEEHGIPITVSAPLGQPAVFYRHECATGPQFLENLRAEGVLQ